MLPVYSYGFLYSYNIVVPCFLYIIIGPIQFCTVYNIVVSWFLYIVMGSCTVYNIVMGSCTVVYTYDSQLLRGL